MDRRANCRPRCDVLLIPNGCSVQTSNFTLPINLRYTHLSFCSTLFLAVNIILSELLRFFETVFQQFKIHSSRKNIYLKLFGLICKTSIVKPSQRTSFPSLSSRSRSLSGVIFTWNPLYFKPQTSLKFHLKIINVVISIIIFRTIFFVKFIITICSICSEFSKAVWR